jgi:hypothetical protein
MLPFAAVPLLAALAQAEPPKAAPKASTSTATAAEVDIALESPAAARLRADSTFKGPYVGPTYDPFAGVGVDVSLRNGQFKRFTLTMPSDLRLEVGQLALVPRNPLIQTSPYFTLRKDFNSYWTPRSTRPWRTWIRSPGISASPRTASRPSGGTSR